MCFMPCKDALFWHYVSTTTLVGLENNVGRDGFISRFLEHPYVGGFDHTRFLVPFGIGSPSRSKVFEALCGHGALECRHHLLDC